MLALLSRLRRSVGWGICLEQHTAGSTDRPALERPLPFPPALGCLLSVLVGLLGSGIFLVLITIAVQGEIRVRRGELGETRVWLIREEKDRGLGISTTTVVSGSESAGKACAETRVRFLMLVAEQEREPLTYCECFAKVGEAWSFVGECPEPSG